MTMSDPDSPVRRMTIAIAAAVAIMVAAGLVYLLVVSKETVTRFNGAAIVAAARDYTRDLQARKQLLPKSVSLEELVTQHYLKPGEIEAFHGLNAMVMLTGSSGATPSVVMQVHFPDGGDIVLLSDGSVQQVSH